MSNEEVATNKLDEEQTVEGIEKGLEENDNEIEKVEKELEEVIEEEAKNFKELYTRKEDENKANLDKLLRTMAEYDNFRKRTIKEKSDMYDKGVMDTVIKFLDILDNFKRAIGQFNPNELTEAEKPMYDGLVLLEKQFNQSLSALGVKEIDAIGCEFDPNIHNAVTHIQDENLGENVVAEEFQKGYIYNEKVIRYSMVKVAN